MDKFTQAYIEAALWSSMDADDRGGEPMDANYSVKDIACEAIDKMTTDCDSFQREAARRGIDFGAALAKQLRECSAEEYAGHDFWLTRNHHGCGFWDGDWHEPMATELNKLAHSFGECNLYVGDDGLIYAM